MQAAQKTVINGGANKFLESRAKNIVAAQKATENCTSSSEDEGELDEKTILDALYKHYEPTSSRENQLGRTSGFLENILHSGAASCLICIGGIRRSDSIWSCKNCFCIFHLNCISRWANDSLKQLKVRLEQQPSDQGHYNHLGEFISPKKQRDLHWCCPQCRREYLPSDKPSQYECFCGKEIHPKSQPFLVPHSCGEICEKLLQPKCGHKCNLLCHPGPCPPCAQFASKSCLCGKSPVRPVRCIDKNWKCKQLCKDILPCGKHVCNQVCHPQGHCPPCSKTSDQPCDCGLEVMKRNCSDLRWKCKKACGAKYSCGLHTCMKVCHTGSCGECPLGLPRSCPCGKSSKIGPCTESVENCGDTCLKLLPCGIHTCPQRCHKGDCNKCFVIIKKKCRCGLHQKELPCSKEFCCETKCKQMRDCTKHACNRKCCDGQCPPCEKICGKQLSCNKHKCQSVCHNGPCYPCNLKSNLNCRCGKTRRSVPCGRERNARIVCTERCRIASKCHHPTTHRCHKGDCPPCNEKCGLQNDSSGCGHTCSAKCHFAVRLTLKSTTSQKKYEYKTLPHPICNEKVLVTCIGGHEIAEWPCWNSKPSSCQRKCNRKLLCGSHNCQLTCHSVPDIKDMKQQKGCANCEEGCSIPRPSGCTHPCTRSCHLPPCAPCSFNIKTKCYCGLVQVMYKCSEFYNTSGTHLEIKDRQERLKCCGNRCHKNFPCGHRCGSICHAGKCPNPESCRKKVKIFCDCKRQKLEVGCDKYRGGQTAITCDDLCYETRDKVNEIQKQQLEQIRRDEEAKNRLEVEQFEKKFAKRKFRERKQVAKSMKAEFNWRLLAVATGVLSALLIAFAVAFYAEN